jgi:hypothetical protein
MVKTRPQMHICFFVLAFIINSILLFNCTPKKKSDPPKPKENPSSTLSVPINYAEPKLPAGAMTFTDLPTVRFGIAEGYNSYTDEMGAKCIRPVA